MHVNQIRNELVSKVQPDWFATRLAEAGGFILVAVANVRIETRSITIEPGSFVLIHLSVDSSSQLPCLVVYDTEKFFAHQMSCNDYHKFTCIG
jgi:hypothetical protein